ncbi:hypothetical protein EW145_g5531 [Phellinidium pouzarii]|uniref:FAD-binding PCMH-type domain-containing protein n=1 Tax=Phellinidium pouzarii TaxID=167371 RepID=A0A4S4L0Z2_9AGAM|nr:hypothetical protein EW145_g5531 [Phellinidium pouzarii]
MAALSRTFKLILLLFALLETAAGTIGIHDRTREHILVDICKEVASTISAASDVYYPPSAEYTADILHYASSSMQMSACSVEPGSAEDVGVILKIVQRTRTPFAVKSGGHATNPGFSSTEGVHISMTRFNGVGYDPSSGTADIGTGLIWDDVYAALAKHNVSVAGGRVSGIGVAGFTLGGGYTWLTNQHGLSLDTVEAFELVLPDGAVTKVTSSSSPDLFFGLRGGFNNFGIVTQITLKTFAQEQVWGGQLTFTSDNLDAIVEATANFSASNTDPKAQIITEFNFIEGQADVFTSIFYDGPSQPDGIFDEFLAIEAAATDISTRPLLSLVQSAQANATAGLRGAYETVSVTSFSVGLLNVIVNETIFWGTFLEALYPSGTFVSYDIEPFFASLFTHGSDSAYPPSRAQGLFPLNIYYAWNVSSADDFFRDKIRQSATTIKAAAVAEGQDIADAALYSNYAVIGTSIDQIYGQNVDRLKRIKARYDPENVMGLAGGWKIPSW